jgi:pilus assembly protein Flp/PilA
MRKTVTCFWKDTSGAASLEYGLIAAGLSLAIATVLQGIGFRIAMNSVPAETLLR